MDFHYSFAARPVSQISRISWTIVVLGAWTVAGCSSERDRSSEPLGSAQQALSANLVIAEAYPGGGNNGAPFKNDFVVLFNRGTTAAPLNGLYLQFSGAAANFVGTASDAGDGGTIPNAVTLPNVSLQPGQHYLIKMYAGPAGNGADVPSPDMTADTINVTGMIGGKLALVSSLLDGCGLGGDAGTTCPMTNVIDFVGWGPVGQWEGSAAAPAPSAGTESITRKGGGCTETDENSTDFENTTPNPLGTTSPLAPCSGDGGTTDGATDATGTGGGAGAGGAAGAAGSGGGTAGGGAGGSGATGGGGTGGGGTGGTGGAKDAGVGGKSDAGLGGKKSSSSDDDDGCGCAVPGQSRTDAGLVAMLGLLAVAMRRRRR